MKLNGWKNFVGSLCWRLLRWCSSRWWWLDRFPAWRQRHWTQSWAEESLSSRSTTFCFKFHFYCFCSLLLHDCINNIGYKFHYNDSLLASSSSWFHYDITKITTLIAGSRCNMFTVWNVFFSDFTNFTDFLLFSRVDIYLPNFPFPLRTFFFYVFHSLSFVFIFSIYPSWNLSSFAAPP